MTRDEFLDIMGEIDQELIDDTLDISRGKAVRLQYERSYVWRSIAGIAACIAILVTSFTVGYFRSVPTQSGSSSGVTYSQSGASDIIRGWDPEELVYSATPVLGGNMRVSVAELDGITAELILHNIQKEAGIRLFGEDEGDFSDIMEIVTPDLTWVSYPVLLDPSDYDYFNDYVGAEDIVLYVHDDKGRRFIETSVTPHSHNGMELIAANCLFDDCTRLYNVKGDYILMQYADQIFYDHTSDRSLYLARFYKLDLDRKIMRDENGIYTGGLISVKFDNGLYSCNWEYGYPVTREFEYVPSGYFYDSGYENQTTHGYTFEGIEFYTTIPEGIMFKLLP